MKLLRISTSLLAFSMVTALAACGGGGGGGSTIPSPGGGNGPTPAPTSSPTTSPTTAPTSSPTPGSVGVSSVILNGGDGYVNGKDNWQTNGVTASDAGDGDTSAGGTGSNTVDGISCSLPGGEATGAYYHVHAFVGIMVNGTEYAMPDAVGMKNPDSNEPIVQFGCAYNLHTHGASGIIHVEDPSVSATASAPSQYNLQSLFDIWGQSLAALPISGVAGVPAVYVGTPSGKNPATGDDLVNSYSASASAPSSILLSHHTAIWLIYGTPPSAGLPQVDFRIST